LIEASNRVEVIQTKDQDKPALPVAADSTKESTDKPAIPLPVEN